MVNTLLFSDLENHWAGSCINQLAQRNLIRGYPDGTFRPNAPVNRAEFAALLLNLFPDILPVRKTLDFSDVPTTYWAYKVIQKVTESGFLSGYPDRTFKPTAPLSRLQIFLALANGLKCPIPPNPAQIVKQYFADFNQIPDYAVSAIAAAAEAKLIVNYPNVRQLNPNQNATRGEVVAALYQTLSKPWQISPISPYIVGNPLSFPSQDYFQDAVGSIGAEVKDFRLTITRQAQVVYNQGLPILVNKNKYYTSFGVRIIDLDKGGEPEIIVTGCNLNQNNFISWIYQYQTSLGQYTKKEYKWGDIGYQLQDINQDKNWKFITYQRTFDIFSENPLDSALPILIWQWQKGDLMNVTENSPEAIRVQANQLWTEQINRQRRNQDVKALLAAYLADKYLIGQKRDGWLQIRQLYQGSDASLYFDKIFDTLATNNYLNIEFLGTAEFEQIEPFFEGLSPVKQNGKWGYLDDKGNTVIFPQFIGVEVFSQGKACVRQNNQYGLINRQGNFLILAKFDTIVHFEDDLLPVEIAGKWGYIDSQGKMIISPQFEGADKFCEGLALVWNGDKYGYIDITGKTIISLKFEGGDRFYQGIGRVWVRDKIGFIDQTGNFVIPPQFDYADPFINEITRVCQGNKWGYLSLPDSPLQISEGFTLEFDYADTIYLGWGRVRQGNLWGYVDLSGKIAITPQFDSVDNFEGNFARVKKGTLYGIIDKTGKLVVPATFNNVGNLVDNIAWVKIQQKYGYVDGMGTVIIIPQFDEAYPFQQNLARVKLNNKYGYIDRKGKSAIAPQFDNAKDFTEGLAPVKINNQWGYIHETGKMIITPQFDWADNFIKNNARVLKNGKWGYLLHPLQ